MAPQPPTGIRPPEGIEPRHLDAGPPLRRHSSVLSLGILGLVMIWGLSGHAGDRRANHVIDNPAGRFEVTVPDIVRCGNVIETRIQVVAKRRIDKLVIAVDEGLWRQITTNSMLPAAGGEASTDGQHRFSYDAVEAGQTFALQIEQQVNPKLFGANHGRLAFMDGDRPLADIALDIQVLP